MKSINFEQWYDEDIEEVFGIEKVRSEIHLKLQEWLQIEKVFGLNKRVMLLQNLLLENVDAWNEEELKMLFISPLLSEVNFNFFPHYKVFLERKATIKTGTVEAQGKIEWMVAQGRHRPKSSFFFLHEYKREGGGTYNPLGQLLVAMVYAQTENEGNFPIYGSYVVGRLCFFVVLDDKKYAVSRAYDATQDDDLPQIIENLKKVKKYIHQQLNLEVPIFE